MDPDPHWRLSAPEPDWLFTLTFIVPDIGVEALSSLTA
jgi:hypothetical protein